MEAKCSITRIIFSNGTTINGVDCSDMTAKEAETKIKEQAANYTLNVKFKDNDTKSVSGKDIDYTYAGDGSVESVLKKQNSFLWFLGNGGKEKDSQVTMQYSQEKLDAVIDGFDEFQSADGENAPASAYITFQNNEFEIVDAVMGEGMDLTLAKQCIENALINADTEVDLEKAGVYDGTLVTADDETLNAQKDQLNELVRASITYSMPDGTTQVLDGNTMKDWLAVDADGNYSKDENQWNERVKEYVANLAAAIDTDGKDHTFPATGIGRRRDHQPGRLRMESGSGAGDCKDRRRSRCSRSRCKRAAVCAERVCCFHREQRIRQDVC